MPTKKVVRVPRDSARVSPEAVRMHGEVLAVKFFLAGLPKKFYASRMDLYAYGMKLKA